MGVTLKLPWAPSANQIWRNHRAGQVYLSKKYQDFLKLAYYAWLEQGSPTFKEEAAQVELNLFPPSSRPYDVDNRIKPTLDALTKMGFWTDDRIVRKVTAVASVPVAGGAIIVNVEAFNPRQLVESSQETAQNMGLLVIPPKGDGKSRKNNKK